MEKDPIVDRQNPWMIQKVPMGDTKRPYRQLKKDALDDRKRPNGQSTKISWTIKNDLTNDWK